jgi:hypothetical protein
MKEPQSGKTDVVAERTYESPRIEKRRELAEVVEGIEPQVTDGALRGKGGCFERNA